MGLRETFQYLLSAQDNGFTSTMRRSSDAVGDFSRTLGSADTNMGAVVGTFGSLAGAMATAGASLSLFAGFDDSMRSLGAIVNGTEEDMQNLENQARLLGSTTRYTASEVASGMTEIARAGAGVEDVQMVAPAALALAAATGKELGMIADMLTDVKGQFGLAFSDANDIADVLGTTANRSAQNIEQLGYAMSYVGAIGSSMGYSVRNISADLAVLADAGIKGERGGTALRAAFTRLVKPMAKAEVILDRYGINIYDSTGKVKAFADIIDDLSASNMTLNERFTVFGQVAGPAMAKLVAVGGDAIRKYDEILKDVTGNTKKMAEAQEAGIGGSFRKLVSSTQELGLVMGGVLAPAVKATADMLANLALSFSGMPGWLQQSAVYGGLLAVSFMAINKALLIMTSTGALAWLAKAGTFLAGMSVPLALLAAGAAVATLQVGKLGAAMMGLSAQAKLLKESQEQTARSSDQVALKLAKISLTTGVTVNSMADLKKAMDEGRLSYDQNLQKWIAGEKAKSEATEQSLESMQAAFKAEQERLDASVAAYKKYSDEIKKIQDKIAGREVSLQEKLRDMQRTGMSELSAWKDLKNQADEYYASAQKAAEAGDFDSAVKLADKAQSAYEKLNKEVKDGEKVAVSQQNALKTAMQGVEKSGNLAVDSLKKQEEAASKAADVLNQDSNWELGEAFTEAGKEAKALNDEAAELNKIIKQNAGDWGKTWTEMERKAKSAIDKTNSNLDKLTKDRHVTVYIHEKKSGGSIYSNYPEPSSSNNISYYPPSVATAKTSVNSSPPTGQQSQGGNTYNITLGAGSVKAQAEQFIGYLKTMHAQGV